jgi:hypothetical protein
MITSGQEQAPQPKFDAKGHSNDHIAFAFLAFEEEGEEEERIHPPMSFFTGTLIWCSSLTWTHGAGAHS